jgi:protein gp37
VSDKTGIAWTDATWSPVTGCSKVSPGCAHCYAEALAFRFGTSKWGRTVPWTPANAWLNVMLHPERLDEPLHWLKPRRVFVCSMSDLFHEQVPDGFIVRIWNRMASATADCGKTGKHEHEEECWCGPRHTFQILTKRPERMRDFLLDTGEGASGISRVTEYWSGDCCYSIAREVGDWPFPNVWLGVSIENARYAYRADILRQTPAAVRFISAEPLLGPLPSLDLTGISWLIIGGESGPGHRPMEPEWALNLIEYAHSVGCKVFVKQGSGPRPGMQGDLPDWAFALREYPQ